VLGEDSPGGPDVQDELGVGAENLLQELRPVDERPEILGAEDEVEVSTGADLVCGGGPAIEPGLLDPQVPAGVLQPSAPPEQLHSSSIERPLQRREPASGAGQLGREVVDAAGELVSPGVRRRQLVEDPAALLVGFRQGVTGALETGPDPLELGQVVIVVGAGHRLRRGEDREHACDRDCRSPTHAMTSFNVGGTRHATARAPPESIPR
jgi:hypothetical protein